MRILDTEFITDTAAMPVKKGTLDFLQQSYKEMLTGLCSGMFPSIDTSTGIVNVIYGLVNTFPAPTAGTGAFHSDFDISDGLVLYNGELFFVSGLKSADTHTIDFGLVLVINDDGLDPYVSSLIPGLPGVSVLAPDADPVKFTDGSQHNVHRIRTMSIVDAPAGDGTPGYVAYHVNCHYNNASNIGEIKMYTGDLSGFDSTGRATIPGWYGWALCNGATYGSITTADLRGKFIAGYDPTNGDYALHHTGGEETHLLTHQESGLPDHTHTILVYGSGTSNLVQEGFSGSSVGHSPTQGVDGGAQNASSAHENRPPYYTLAFVQRIF